MEFIIVYFIINLVFLIPVLYAADKRDVSLNKALLVSFVFSPIIGFLFILCHPTRAEVKFQREMLDMMDNLMNKSKEEEK